MIKECGNYGLDGVAFHFLIERVVFYVEQINIITVKWALEMFKDIMIERLFGFINDEQENKYYDFEDTILLLFKIEDLDTFM